MRRKSFLVTVSLSIVVSSFGQNSSSNYLYRCNEKLVEIIMEDLFTPPVASRVQVYPNIAAYEVLCFKDKSLRSLAGQLNGLSSIAAPDKKVDLSFSALTAFTSMARRLIYSEYMIDAFQKAETEKWLAANNNDTTLLNNSVAYGRQSADQLFVWLKKDNYDYTRTLSRYVVVDSAGAWQPTAPDYGNAVEPNWWLVRSFVFDSSTMIRSVPPLKYSEQKNSAFYKSSMQVLAQSKKKDTIYRLIASYWDCNPNITKSAGHFTYYVHKISPAGHWIRITGQALKNLALDESTSAKTYLLVTLGLYEGFLSCWTDKFHYNTVRPETYINKLISPKWKPYIETPPFPEYPSGHSVISSTTATILTGMIPQPYCFTDSSEMYINLPSRSFNSFRDAANEASVSRFYGGIHFMEALNNGIDQGKLIGNYILQKIKLTN
ncbi:MAG TPA: vanadium-dependent haloperoxidase [Chitinophagaceae bacterium]|nr:vanadium-dependent haloperoxidase [Chitinophagaceae bacterium]